MIAAGLDPIAQFEIHKLAELKIGKYDISFTNSALMMVITVACIALWLLLSTSKKSLIPGRAQSIAELSYEFIADMLRSSAGKDGMRFFPFVFALFIFILFANLLGMIPFFFTSTSHIVVTAILAGSGPNNLHDLAHVSEVGSEQHRYVPHNISQMQVRI